METVDERAKATGVVCGPDHPIAKARAKKQRAEKMVIKPSETHDHRRRLVQTALDQKFSKRKGDSKGSPVDAPAYHYIRDLTDDTVVFEKDGGDQFAMSYSIESGKATLEGDPIQVGTGYYEV